MNNRESRPPLALDEIGGDYREAVTVQSYRGSPPIEGVTFAQLRVFSDEGGDFCEMARLNEAGDVEAFDGYRPAQVSYSLILPGAIKAWHLHFAQDDAWFVPPGDRLLVGLVDLRETSPTRDAYMRFVLGAGKAQIVLIPRGVAHGVANRSDSPGSIIYLTNNQFDPANPDERRLPFDHFGSDFWDLKPA